MLCNIHIIICIILQLIIQFMHTSLSHTHIHTQGVQRIGAIKYSIQHFLFYLSVQTKGRGRVYCASDWVHRFPLIFLTLDRYSDSNCCQCIGMLFCTTLLLLHLMTFGTPPPSFQTHKNHF